MMQGIIKKSDVKKYHQGSRVKVGTQLAGREENLSIRGKQEGSGHLSNVLRGALVFFC